MRSFYSIIAVLLTLLLVFTALSSCGKKKDNGPGTDEYGETLRPTVITSPEDTAPTIVPSPSLDSVEMIGTIGVQCGDTILECESSRGNGAIFDGQNATGDRLWKAVLAEAWAVNPNVAIPEGFPTLVASKGSEVSVCNRTGHEITSDYYVDFSSGESFEPNALPDTAGIYIRVVTIEIPRPSRYDPDPEIGAFFGELYYFVVVAFG